ncbi:G patch domain-containing protein 1 [Lindgomyces ingoldianus]|uniref:G patch domain-containing protein 1 n=1 Tax=Lindgomyces ingoldianus TaxID=673940 RepID=A0ACB6R0D7_9PLEO|nr:G patch domain-containing protein 1 [Lindgomyces ingoldianus]KAF2471972.1 G patch domain-containing protein 1 [Lindgomyces ingoldianus]
MAYKRPRPPSPTGSQKRSRPSQCYVKCGTPMSLDVDGDDQAFVPVWKQIVTDEHGRRRLHGAFTGGFSAGYFNTVGSKEGWTPKAFVSSRSRRNKDQSSLATQRPEDFMDDEDFADAAESRQLETDQNFAGIGATGESEGARDDFFGLMTTEDETMGVKLMQKMGWRRGEGIGPRVRRSARLDDDKEGTVSMTSESEQLFAPKDTHIKFFTPRKLKCSGLGYQSDAYPLLKPSDSEVKPRVSPALLSIEGVSKHPKPMKPAVKRTGMGVGVLNDNGSDDEDPYELGPRISFNRTIGKDKKAKNPSTIKPSKFAKVSTGQRHMFVPQKHISRTSSSVARLCHDGRSPLRAFKLLTITDGFESRHKLPPPKVPGAWRSSKQVPGSGARAQSFQSVADAARSSTLDAKGRATVLGEKALPGKSIFDYISKEDRDLLAAKTGKNLPPGLGQPLPKQNKTRGVTQPNDLWTWVPALDKGIAAAALSKGTTGWMPYGEDSKKRARYTSFLEVRAGLKDGLPERVPGTTNADWAQELREFAQAAQVFKPVQGLMASRFTSSTSSTPSAHPGSGSGPSENTLLRAPTTKPDDPAETAAKLGMYGAMTRTAVPFHPTRILCKRFNVKPPPNILYESEFGTSASSKTQEPVSKAAMDQMFHEAMTAGSVMQYPLFMTPQAKGSALFSSAEHAPVDSETNEALLKERAPDDVFRALFGDDDDN